MNTTILTHLAKLACEHSLDIRVRSADGVAVYFRPASSCMTSAQRVAKHRAAKKAEAQVTDVTDVTHVTEGVTSVTNPLPPLPPPLSPTPPIPPTLPTHPCSSSACVREGPPPEKPKRKPPTLRADRLATAAAASESPIPASLDSQEFRAAWEDWCAHRTALAAADPRKPWTPTAAKQTLKLCHEAGQAQAVVAIRHAVANSWQGLHFAPATPANGTKTAPPTVAVFDRWNQPWPPPNTTPALF